MAGQFEAFFIGAHRQDLDGFFHEVIQVEVDGFQLKVARFDFGQIQDVVDKRQEVAAGAPEAPQIFSLVRREFCFPQQVRHPDDRVHRRTDFVANAGEKLALRPAGDLRRLFGEDEGLLRFTALVGFQHKGDEGGQRTREVDIFRRP